MKMEKKRICAWKVNLVHIFVSLGCICMHENCKMLTEYPNGILYFLTYECEMNNMFNYKTKLF